ncbi:MAG: UDP-N-acetylglucosamine--N-acetylmuramyl-(pentapeptide) pyrophosphoryl-undecaprenol N-acetylglucosamine transferase [Candidatus Nealsonbacteria bacterium]|nr:UDP-N-acetylglucosamine--N-acetylmuramyl-(pentapeptide) pyrophosphoryl-undecaprenol N-acetylglucosamine transferase [Candidatus Nealsonbacteria bacterium]
MKILFTGGGTAGHILPIIAIVREIKKVQESRGKTLGKKEIRFFYLGPKDEFGKTLLFQEGIKVKEILAGKIRRYFSLSGFFKNIIDILFKIPIGFFQSFFYIFFLAPDLIFSKGGYGSYPVVLAGRVLSVPIFLHESDSIPGLSNRSLSKFALEIFVSFPVEEMKYFPRQKMISVGNPIRQEILEGKKEEAQKLFNLTMEKPIILILGGSQGAQRINDRILEVLPELLENFEILHQVGKRNYDQIKSEVKLILGEGLKKYYHFFPFLNEEQLKSAFAACDIIVSRAGSGVIFEIAALGKPAFLIPLAESSQGHQIKNAYLYAQTGACSVLEEANFTPRFFLEKLKYLISQQPLELEKMKKAAKEFAKPKAGRMIAEYIIEYLTPLEI